MPKNYVKTSIVLFIGQDKKLTAEIRDYLKKIHYISEPRGVRLHLEHLCTEHILDKTVQNGIGTHYFWKKDVESFKKIINMFSQNNEMVRDILKQKFALKKIHNKSARQYETNLLQRIKDTSIPFDTTEFWYNTKYTEYFIKNSVLECFINKAYQKCILDSEFVD